MRISRRTVLTAAVAATALTAFLILLSVLALAQPASTPPSQAHSAAPARTTQAISVTFPPGPWPWYAQGEISVHPEPPIAEHPTEICAKVINNDPVNPHTATLEFGVANFGIGVPFMPVGVTIVEVPPNGHAQGCVMWIPPEPSHWCIEVLLTQQGEPEVQRSQRNIDVWEPLAPGEQHELVFPVGPLPEPGWVTFTIENLLPGWDAFLTPLEFSLDNGTVQTVTLTTIPPVDAVLGAQMPVVDIEGFLDGETIGGFRKLDWPPVPLHRLKDPFFAESEISVWPYPPRAGEPTEICVELFNLSDEPQIVEVQFSVADFGIGLPFDPVHAPIEVEIPPHSYQKVCKWWIPPEPGQFCVQVQLNILGDIPYHPQFSQLNLDVGEPPSRPFRVGNPYQYPVTITLGLIPHSPNWELALSQDVLTNVLPGPEGERIITLTVAPPDGQPLPPDGHPIVDVQAYVDDQLIGGFRKIHRPPVPIHRFPDPSYAEREITVEPYPPLAGEPTEVCVELYNPTPAHQEVEVQFSWANFGIGIPFTPINGLREVHLPPYSVVNECIHWIPPVSGHVCLQVELHMGDYPPQRSQRNIDVDEPLVPGELHSRPFRVGNPYQHPVTITLGLIPHLPNWDLALSQDVLTNVLPGPEGERIITLTVTPPDGQPLPPDESPIVDVEAFAKGELIGGFRKIFRPPVPIHRPKDPMYAESEIFVHPYPPREREPTELGVEIRNPTDVFQPVTVTFSVAPFGIGLPFMPVNEPITVTVPPGGMVRPGTVWLPPEGDLWCIQVELELPGHNGIFYSQRNIDVGEPLEPNTPHSRPFPVGNPFTHPVTVTLGLIPHFPDWGLELSEDIMTDMGPGEVRTVTLTVTPPNDLPADGDPVVDVEAFVDGQLIGGFRKLFRPPVPIHRPQDPVYAESEIGIDPYPVLPGQSTELSVEVFNPTDQDHVVTVTFSIAPFGIGLPFSTTHIAPNPILIFVPAHGAARGHVLWEPPDWFGKFCVQVELELPGHEKIWSRRNIDVGEPLEPGVPHSLVFEVGSWPYAEPVTITLGLINHREGWDVSLSDMVLTDVAANPVTVTLTVTPADGAILGLSDPVVDVEAFVDGALLGGFRKIDRPPIPLHKPHEKSYAESEIDVVPYPPQVGQEGRIGTVVQNNTTDTPMTVTLEFGWAKFGMGIPFSTTGVSPVSRTLMLSPGVTETAWVSWTPTLAGNQCVRILLNAEGYEPQESQRNVWVEDQPPCGTTQAFTLTMRNDSPLAATVDIGLITFDVPDDWKVTLVPSDTLELGPYSEGVVTVTVQIPCLLTLQAIHTRQEISALQEKAGGVPTVDVEGYIDGELVGGIELRFGTGTRYVIYLPIVVKND